MERACVSSVAQYNGVFPGAAVSEGLSCMNFARHGDALIADINPWTGNQLCDLVYTLAAERTFQISFEDHRSTSVG
jgi:hypothetical protein